MAVPVAGRALWAGIQKIFQDIRSPHTVAGCLLEKTSHYPFVYAGINRRAIQTMAGDYEFNYF